MVSSTLLALNLKISFNEVSAAKTCLICEIQENIKLEVLNEMNRILFEKNVGKIFLIYRNENDTAFTIELKELTEGYKLTQRLLWEFGFLLSSKIILVKPRLKVLKEYGKGLL